MRRPFAADQAVAIGLAISLDLCSHRINGRGQNAQFVPRFDRYVEVKVPALDLADGIGQGADGPQDEAPDQQRERHRHHEGGKRQRVQGDAKVAGHVAHTVVHGEHVAHVHVDEFMSGGLHLDGLGQSDAGIFILLKPLNGKHATKPGRNAIVEQAGIDEFIFGPAQRQAFGDFLFAGQGGDGALRVQLLIADLAASFPVRPGRAGRPCQKCNCNAMSM